MAHHFRIYDVPKPIHLKRLIAILFLLLLLFNIGGYHALQWLLSVQATLELADQIENNQHDSSQEITLAIPMSLPYGAASPDNHFEHIRGDFEYKANHYKFIKKKLQHDTLYLVCIKNIQKENVDRTIDRYAKASNDQDEHSKQTLNLLSKLFKDFQPATNISATYSLQIESRPLLADKVSVVLDPAYPIPSPPPKSLS